MAAFPIESAGASNVRFQQAIIGTGIFGLVSVFPLGLGGLEILVKCVLMYIAYRLASGNKAGGYYDSSTLGLGMLTNLPRHFKDLYERQTDDKRYVAGLKKEKSNGIFRTINALETALGFLLFSYGGALGIFLKSTVHHGQKEVIIQVGCTIVFALAHRLIAKANIGESLWKLASSGRPIPLKARIDSQSY
ncbi:hypothetical protein AAMO2058_000575300 [Amorphochlora amoebiformis]